MTFANCPKCGSFNVTTAGVCANCGWTRFPQVMGAGESKEAIYNLVGELEIKMSGKALLDDYKRLLFESNSLTARIAELEAERRWIPVSERLPEEYVKVIAFAKDCMNVDWVLPEDLREVGKGAFARLYNVTHWMPLPKLPEVQE